MDYAIYEGYQLIYNIIQNNVLDVNPSRREKNGRWVYPTLPTSLDENYPRITIKLSNYLLNPVSAGNVFYFSKDTRSYGYQVSLTYTILLIIKKETEYPIELNGNVIRAKNELLAEWLAKEVYKALFNKLIIEHPDNFWVLPSSLSYNPVVWEYDTSRMITELGITLNGYEEIVKQVSDGSVIEVINHLINVEE